MSIIITTVAPYVGAWIETNSKELAQYQHASHPMWVRGLKRKNFVQASSNSVAPYVGAWIETRVDNNGVVRVVSHPMWVRGLKHAQNQL